MGHSKRAATVTLAAMGLFLSAGSMAASQLTELAPASSIDVCVAQIEDHANYDDASRVRHVIESSKRRNHGHLLKVDTTVYGETEDDVIREYAATCVVARNGTQLKFEIKETKIEA